MKTVLIDGDEVAYKAAFVSEVPIKWDEDTWTLHSSEREMIDAIQTIIKQAMKDTHSDMFYVALSGSNNFRLNVYPEYKANRKNKRKPLGLKFCREYMLESYFASMDDTLEADDLLAIHAGEITDSVIWSVDKDFLTVPCNLFRDGTVQVITKEDADYWLKYQTMVGDVADNFKGAVGFGPKKTTKWLKDKGATWNSVRNAFLSAGQTEDDCTTNAILARILRTEDEKLNWRPDYEN
ncbi:MAG: putative ribonuclease H [Prokaryotic dsDNA virus sp.]|jgi:DNA polymerase-1|nr:MAG: putative ribonuclease H [Prokaryotic dsDNA virus sp.]